MNENKQMLIGFGFILAIVIIIVGGGLALFYSITGEASDEAEYASPDDEVIEFIDEAFTVFTLGNVKCQGSHSEEFVSQAEMHLDSVMLVYMLSFYDREIDQYMRDGKFGDDQQLVRDAVMVSNLGNELRSCLSAAEMRYGW